MIITDLYFVQFYYQLVDIVFSKCSFHHEDPRIVMQQFYEETLRWAVPVPGVSLELGLFGYLIQIDLPNDMLENVSP